MIKNILIIEEDSDSLELIKEILEEEEYFVFCAPGMEQGISVLNQGIRIDLIIVSVVIDNKVYFGGIDFLKKSSFSFIPIVALVSSVETDEGKRAVQHGAVDFIAKPIAEPALLSIIKNTEEKEYGKNTDS